VHRCPRSTTYAYDDENRLIQVNTGTGVIAFAYDPFGRRISRSVDGTVIQYVYDQDAIIAVYDPSGNVIARYAHGLAIDEPLAVQQGSSIHFYHADALGSIVALTNTSGGLAQTYSYDSFGNVTPNGSVVQPYTFTAREYDTETGLYYFKARYYDPRAGMSYRS
jgi:YD repeat-containing protein